MEFIEAVVLQKLVEFMESMVAVFRKKLSHADGQGVGGLLLLLTTTTTTTTTTTLTTTTTSNYYYYYYYYY